MAIAVQMPSAYQEQITKLSHEEKLNLVEFILQTMHLPSFVEDKATQISNNHQLDDALYGSLHLPADFDYKKELESSIAEKHVFQRL